MNGHLRHCIMLSALILAAAWGVSPATAQDGAGDMAQPETADEPGRSESAAQPARSDAAPESDDPADPPSAPAEAAEAEAPAGDAAQAAANGADLVTRVRTVQRNALWRADAGSDWQPVTEGRVLPVGAELRTSVGSRVVLAVGPNVDLTVGPLSRFIVGRLERDGQAIRTRVAVPMGNVDYEVKDVGFENDLAITTPSGTMAVKGTTGNLLQYDQTDIDNDEGNVTFLTPYSRTVFIDGQGNLFGPGNNRGSGAGGNNTENDNQGDGNNNDTGNPLPNRDTLDGNNSRRNTQRQFERDLQGGGGGGDL